MREPVNGVVTLASGTECGQRRYNQDRHFADHTMLVVCDGMGGGNGGELAASLALSAVVEYISRGLFQGIADPSGAVAAADTVVRRLRETPELSSSGTTVTALVVHEAAHGPTATLSWVGDSPAWLARDGVLYRLTRPDHQAQKLADQGLIEPYELDRHPAAAHLLRAAGVGSVVPPPVVTVELEDGDRLLVASDGLLQVLTDPQVEFAFHEAATPGAAVEDLLVQAADNDPTDNVTLAVAFFSRYPSAGVTHRATGPLCAAEAVPPSADLGEPLEPIPTDPETTYATPAEEVYGDGQPHAETVTSIDHFSPADVHG